MGTRSQRWSASATTYGFVLFLLVTIVVASLLVGEQVTLIAALYAILGEKELAFQWLEKAYREHSTLLTELRSEFWFENIRPDPRFTALLTRVGLADEKVRREE